MISYALAPASEGGGYSRKRLLTVNRKQLERARVRFVQGRNWAMFRGDCRKVLPLFGETHVAHAIFDPPYSEHVHKMVRSGRRDRLADRDDFACRARRTVDLGFGHLTAELRDFMASWCATHVHRWTLAFSDVESSHLWRDAFRAAGAEYVRTCHWHRLAGAPQFSGDRPAEALEDIIAAHAMHKGRKKLKVWNGGGKAGFYAHAVVTNRGGRVPRLHETQKPEKLMLELVDDFTNEREVVIDLTAGSGTTGVACLRLGRRFIGIEQRPRDFDNAVRRLRAVERESAPPAQMKRGEQTTLFFAFDTEHPGSAHGSNAARVGRAQKMGRTGT